MALQDTPRELGFLGTQGLLHLGSRGTQAPEGHLGTQAL